MVPYVNQDLQRAIVRQVIFNTYDIATELAGDYVKRRIVGFGIRGALKGALKETESYITSKVTGCKHTPVVPGIKFVR